MCRRHQLFPNHSVLLWTSTLLQVYIISFGLHITKVSNFARHMKAYVFTVHVYSIISDKIIILVFLLQRIPSRRALETAKMNVVKYFPVVGLTSDLNNFFYVLDYKIPNFFRDSHSLYRQLGNSSLYAPFYILETSHNFLQKNTRNQNENSTIDCLRLYFS